MLHIINGKNFKDFNVVLVSSNIHDPVLLSSLDGLQEKP